jgi:hypothetical protein
MTVPPAQPDDPTPAPVTPSARERLTDAGLHAASKGASALGRMTDQVSQRVRRKLDERAAAQPQPAPAPRPVAPPQPVAPPAAPPPASGWAQPAAPTWPAPAAPQHSQVVPVAPAPRPVQPTEIVAPARPATHWVPAAPTPPAAPVPQRAPGFNPAAAVAIVVAVLFPPAGLGLARSARRECRETGERGANLALLAHLIAAAGTSLLVLCFLVIASAFAFGMVQLGNGIAGIGDFLRWVSRLF